MTRPRGTFATAPSGFAKGGKPYVVPPGTEIGECPTCGTPVKVEASGGRVTYVPWNDDRVVIALPSVARMFEKPAVGCSRMWIVGERWIEVIRRTPAAYIVGRGVFRQSYRGRPRYTSARLCKGWDRAVEIIRQWLELDDEGPENEWGEYMQGDGGLGATPGGTDGSRSSAEH